MAEPINLNIQTEQWWWAFFEDYLVVANNDRIKVESKFLWHRFTPYFISATPVLIRTNPHFIRT